MQSPRHVPVPDDVIFQILLRLPARSLMRFTSVSKSWKASIGRPSFTRSRTSRLVYISNCLSDHLEVVPWSWIPENIDRVLPRRSRLREDPEPTCGLPVLISLPGLSDSRRMAGSSEGLICLAKESIMYVWNPCSGTIKTLPEGEIPFTPYTDLGFGFAPRSGDHRVVKLLCDRKCVVEVEMYSLASDSWRRVKPPSRLEVSFEKKGLFPMVSFKGSIYWMVAREGMFPCMILRFDLEEERFEVIEVGMKRLVVLDGFLVHLERYEVIQGKLIRVEGDGINEESKSGSLSSARPEDIWSMAVGGQIISFPSESLISRFRLYMDAEEYD